MSNLSDQDLEKWIASRKQPSEARLNDAVMEEIRRDTESPSQAASKSQARPWLLTSVCLLAGIGKLTLVLHFAF